ncbi:hypothetical protein CDCA_CDCA10G2922 [Cyanidium caldarium]|uniref:BAR domain-containing protein n=1 Tax=Cyanidium caldarium TaxID=2771 RepID=A0AAV9IX40_CYACA|nr:hypothetical protein CDCA_CDCA10G2922 [Cyanidium caldarium]
MFHRMKVGLKQSKDTVMRAKPASAPETRYQTALESLNSLERTAKKVRESVAANEPAWRALLSNMEDVTGSLLGMFGATHPFYEAVNSLSSSVSGLESHLVSHGVLHMVHGRGAAGGGEFTAPPAIGVQGVLTQIDEYLRKCKDMRKRAQAYEKAFDEVNYYLGKVEKLEAAQKNSTEPNTRIERNRQKLVEAREKADEACTVFRRGVETLERNREVVFSRTLLAFVAAHLVAFRYAPLEEHEETLQEQYRARFGDADDLHLDWTERGGASPGSSTNTRPLDHKTGTAQVDNSGYESNEGASRDDLGDEEHLDMSNVSLRHDERDGRGEAPVFGDHAGGAEA